jgi:hypothetical protein
VRVSGAIGSCTVWFLLTCVVDCVWLVVLVERAKSRLFGRQLEACCLVLWLCKSGQPMIASSERQMCCFVGHHGM